MNSDTHKKFIKNIKNIIYYGVVIFLVFIISISLFIPNGLVRIVGFGWYRVVSASMEPLIMTGDYIIVTRKDDASGLKDGDIIVFETYFYNPAKGGYGKDIVTHHFYKIDENGYIITYPHSQYGLPEDERYYDPWRKGPNEPYYVTEDDLIGVHKLTLPLAGTINFLTSPYGILVIVINVGLIIGLYMILKKDRVIPKDNEDQSDDVGRSDQN